jgi:hypothetical protein
MKAAFRTDGKTTTQSALSSKSRGMSSGTSRISFNTVPLFLKRSSSFSGSAAEAEEERIGRTTSNMLIRQVSGFFITLLLGGFERQINFRYLVRDELFGAFSGNGFD